MARAKPRRRHGVTPLRQRLTFGGKLIGCTDTAFAMGVEAATLGAIRVTEQVVRLLSDEAHPDPASPGLNLGQLDAVAVKLRVEFTPRRGASFNDLDIELDRNAAVVAQLWYADIGGTAIGHALYLEKKVSGWVYGVDPMKGVYGKWPAADVHRAMRTFAQKAGVPGDGLLFGCFRRAPWEAGNQDPQGPQ